MISCASLNACDETANKSMDTDKIATEKFLQEATSADLFGITSGMIAEENGKSTAVTAFGHELVRVHSKTSEALATIARHRSIQLPEEIAIDKKKVVNQLEDEKGDAFDQTFVNAQITAHQEMIDLYTQADKQIKDPEIQGFVDQILPVLQAQLVEIQKAQTSLIAMN